MINQRYLIENTARIRKNKRKLAIKTVCGADFRCLFISPAQESVLGNYGNVSAESERAGIHMNTAQPIRIQYS